MVFDIVVHSGVASRTTTSCLREKAVLLQKSFDEKGKAATKIVGRRSLSDFMETAGRPITASQARRIWDRFVICETTTRTTPTTGNGSGDTGCLNESFLELQKKSFRKSMGYTITITNTNTNTPLELSYKSIDSGSTTDLSSHSSSSISSSISSSVSSSVSSTSSTPPSTTTNTNNSGGGSGSSLKILYYDIDDDEVSECWDREEDESCDTPLFDDDVVTTDEIAGLSDKELLVFSQELALGIIDWDTAFANRPETQKTKTTKTTTRLGSFVGGLAKRVMTGSKARKIGSGR